MRGQEVVEPCGMATTPGVNSHPARQESEVEETVGGELFWFQLLRDFSCFLKNTFLYDPITYSRYISGIESQKILYI